MPYRGRDKREEEREGYILTQYGWVADPNYKGTTKNGGIVKAGKESTKSEFKGAEKSGYKESTKTEFKESDKFGFKDAEKILKESGKAFPLQKTILTKDIIKKLDIGEIDPTVFYENNKDISKLNVGMMVKLPDARQKDDVYIPPNKVEIPTAFSLLTGKRTPFAPKEYTQKDDIAANEPSFPRSSQPRSQPYPVQRETPRTATSANTSRPSGFTKKNEERLGRSDYLDNGIVNLGDNANGAYGKRTAEVHPVYGNEGFNPPRFEILDKDGLGTGKFMVYLGASDADDAAVRKSGYYPEEFAISHFLNTTYGELTEVIPRDWVVWSDTKPTTLLGENQDGAYTYDHYTDTYTLKEEYRDGGGTYSGYGGGYSSGYEAGDNGVVGYRTGFGEGQGSSGANGGYAYYITAKEWSNGYRPESMTVDEMERIGIKDYFLKELGYVRIGKTWVLKADIAKARKEGSDVISGSVFGNWGTGKNVNRRVGTG